MCIIAFFKCNKSILIMESSFNFMAVYSDILNREK